jgi:hypothetical protein
MPEIIKAFGEVFRSNQQTSFEFRDAKKYKAGHESGISCSCMLLLELVKTYVIRFQELLDSAVLKGNQIHGGAKEFLQSFKCLEKRLAFRVRATEQ